MHQKEHWPAKYRGITEGEEIGRPSSARCLYIYYTPNDYSHHFEFEGTAGTGGIGALGVGLVSSLLSLIGLESSPAVSKKFFDLANRAESRMATK